MNPEGSLGKFATSMDFQKHPAIRFDLKNWKTFGITVYNYGLKKHGKKLTAKQTNPQRILLRLLLGIAALRIRTGVSCVCCTINELRPRSGFRQDLRHKDPLNAASTTSFNMTSKTSLKKIDKICTFLYHLNSASFPHCKTVPSGRGNHGPTKALGFFFGEKQQKQALQQGYDN